MVCSLQELSRINSLVYGPRLLVLFYGFLSYFPVTRGP